MKKLFISLLALGSVLTFNNQAQASCASSYLEKANGMLPKSESGKKAVKMGCGVATAGAMFGTIALGAGPFGLVVGASAGKAYLDKIDRLQFFHDLINAAINVKTAPVSDTGLSGLFEDTRFERIVRNVSRLSGKPADEVAIMESISRADVLEEFCIEDGKENLKTSISSFAKVIVRNL